jgi:hypothetical protein
MHPDDRIAVTEIAVRSKGLGVMADGSCGSVTYEDVVVRTADGWLIRHRRVLARRHPLRPPPTRPLTTRPLTTRPPTTRPPTTAPLTNRPLTTQPPTAWSLVAGCCVMGVYFRHGMC